MVKWEMTGREWRKCQKPGTARVRQGGGLTGHTPGLGLTLRDYVDTGFAWVGKHLRRLFAGQLREWPGGVGVHVLGGTRVGRGDR